MIQHLDRLTLAQGMLLDALERSGAQVTVELIHMRGLLLRIQVVGISIDQGRALREHGFFGIQYDDGPIMWRNEEWVER